MKFTSLCALVLVAAPVAAQRPTLSAAVRQYVAVDSPVVVISHVRVIDGTGAAPKENQTVVVRDGKITYVGPNAAALPLTGVAAIDGTGKSLIPGLVMTHEHMFYPTPGPSGFYS